MEIFARKITSAAQFTDKGIQHRLSCDHSQTGVEIRVTAMPRPEQVTSRASGIGDSCADVIFKYSPIDIMTVDILTKPMGRVKFERFRQHLDVVDIKN